MNLKCCLFPVLLLVLSFPLNGQIKENSFDRSDTVSTFIIEMMDNTSLTGKILSGNENELIFADITLGKVNVPIAKIKKIQRISGDQNCMITTINGKTIIGIIVSQDDKEIIIKTESLGTLSLSNALVRDIKLIEKEQVKEGVYYFENPHPTRYLFGPSAIPLKKGEGYYQNAYLVINGVQVGTSDNFSFGGGMVIPFAFFISPKFGFRVANNFYLGGGIFVVGTLTSASPFGLGIAYGSFTYGNKENSFTFNAGWGALKEEIFSGPPYYTSEYHWEIAQKPMFSISGMARLAPKLSLITENWIFATKEHPNTMYYDRSDYFYKYRSVVSFGLRIMGEKNSFDLAAAFPSIDGETFGIPYIDYVFRF
ncbi:MAG: hypothetical protein H6538_08035 [Bacteroidales bacterium]|nr:hypothetical protein [Bacteroidales bacterium]MCB9000157.1 hypothetical protein [Bacteroidales bacterium]MCB9013514.1 hypothetical protein [Bacteroidales bacterium]